jgi:hypothetical protein
VTGSGIRIFGRGIFSGMVFAFAGSHRLSHKGLAALVERHDGQSSPNMGAHVTHLICSPATFRETPGTIFSSRKYYLLVPCPSFVPPSSLPLPSLFPPSSLVVRSSSSLVPPSSHPRPSLVPPSSLTRPSLVPPSPLPGPPSSLVPPYSLSPPLFPSPVSFLFPLNPK